MGRGHIDFRRIVAAAALTVTVSALLAAQAWSTVPQPVASTRGQLGVRGARVTAPVVKGRSATPEQIGAPGIRIVHGSFDFGLNGHSFTIQANDWDTIVSSSVVQHSVGVSFNTDFHASATTRNRFQYLADYLITAARPGVFQPTGIVAEPSGKSLDTIAALVNPSHNALRFSAMNLVVTESPPTTTVGSGAFYTTPSSDVIIPGDDIYFLYLSLPLLAAPPTTAHTTNFAFHWKLFSCGISCS